MPLIRHRATAAARAFAMALATALTAAPAQAATTCNLSVTPLVFGAYNPVNGPALQIDATISASCVSTTLPLAAVPYSLSIGPSSTSGTMTRQLGGPMGARLSYNLYTSASYGSVWGDGSGGSSMVPGSVTPAALGVPAVSTHTVFGRVPALQSVRVGAYGDSLLVTIDY